jgi:uncharacterized Zn-finger protein
MLLELHHISEMHAVLRFFDVAGLGALGHPIEYMTLHKRSDKPETCKYCGLRYMMNPHGKHHGH